MDEKINNLEIDPLLGHYRIVKKIGAGGMGEVYLAEDTKLDRRVAVKFLNEAFSQDADKLRRFQDFQRQDKIRVALILEIVQKIILQNRDFCSESSEEIAIERWENEGGEVKSLPEM